MGKRSNFLRKERDFYPTPAEAIPSLLPHLSDFQFFCEPCAGNGKLVDELETQTHLECTWRSDITPARKDIKPLDAFDLREEHLGDADIIVTNPPWTRNIFHDLIDHLISLRPTFLLADADWVYTKQSSRFTNKSSLRKIIAIGRLKWFGNITGKDNCSWYLFDKATRTTPRFYGRIL